MKRIYAMVAATVTLLGAFAIAPSHAATCTAGGTLLADPSNTVASVDDGKTVSYKLVVPSGKDGYFNVQMFNGDVDLSVCNVNTGAVVCDSVNSTPTPDGCHIGDPEIEGDLAVWGNPLRPGTYKATINSCFSSKDPDGCDYTGDLVAEAAGATDPLPPVEFVATYTTLDH